MNYLVCFSSPWITPQFFPISPKIRGVIGEVCMRGTCHGLLITPHAKPHLEYHNKELLSGWYDLRTWEKRCFAHTQWTLGPIHVERCIRNHSFPARVNENHRLRFLLYLTLNYDENTPKISNLCQLDFLFVF